MRCCIIRGWFFCFFFFFVDDFLQSILFFLDNWPICGESQSKHSDVILTLRIHPVKTNFSSAFSPLERNGIWLLTRPSNMYFSSWYVFPVFHICIFVLICFFSSSNAYSILIYVYSDCKYAFFVLQNLCFNPPNLFFVPKNVLSSLFLIFHPPNMHFRPQIYQYKPRLQA